MGDKIRRNIVPLCEVLEGRIGRPSKSLTLFRAEAVLKAAEQGPLRMRAKSKRRRMSAAAAPVSVSGKDTR